ncbi:MAG: hypothetical protein L0241_11965 [Planctomycetia bacterium]|nr:hypothetical protein [Planctomycetia bacterium]
MRTLVAVVLFASMTAAVTFSPGTLPAQDKKDEKKKRPKVDPKTFRPDVATLKQIRDKTEELRKAVEALKEKKIPDHVFVEVAIYLKAAENIVRFEEWLHANSVKWALQTLDQGLARAKQAEDGKAVWRDAPGKWVLRAYRSDIDDSIQPYAVLLPHDYGKDPKKKWRLDVVLHGRDSSLTEAKFIATHNGPAPKDLGYIQLEPYGRGNNAYRWAGETDVFEAMSKFRGPSASDRVDSERIVLRGFSMGGAGTWHIGLHHPGQFCVIGPGAGFTTTRGYVANLPKELPDYQEKCLHIYDAVDYAENVFNVPVVAYSGENDPQKKAADNIENALKNFKEPFKFTHLVAPGLEHKMPPEWMAKAETEYRKFADKGRDQYPERIRFVTYTPRYWGCDWLRIEALKVTHERAVVDGTVRGSAFTLTTTNVRRLALFCDRDRGPLAVTIDKEKIEVSVPGKHREYEVTFELVNDKWAYIDPEKRGIRLEKKQRLHGPIDDAFTDWFQVVKPSGASWHPGTNKYATAAVDQFASVWDRYFRGTLPVVPNEDELDLFGRVVLFGDPQSNPLIAKVLPKLPITWTKEKLVVNGVEYDPKTHVPVLIYPNPLKPSRYVVINSGHTFKEADLKGTNALLYPRLGDWAVIKPTPTDKDPAAYEVVAAGLFDENWQFPKKK